MPSAPTHARSSVPEHPGPGFDHPVDARIASLAARQEGHVGRRQLRALGLTDGHIDARLAKGQLACSHHGVLRLAGAPLTLRGRQHAGLLACGDQAVLGFGTAAQVRGLLLDEQRIEVIVPPHVLRRHRGLTVRRCVLPAEEVEVVDGLRVTSCSRTLLDCAAVYGDRTVMRAIDRSLELEDFDLVALDACLRRHPRRAGRARLLRVLALLPDDGSHARSVLEQHLLHLLWTSGLPRPGVDVPVGRFVADLLWPRARLIVEADGLLWHGGPLARRRDRERQRELERAGWQVLRVTWEDVHARPEAVLVAVATALTERSKHGP